MTDSKGKVIVNYFLAKFAFYSSFSLLRYFICYHSFRVSIFNIFWCEGFQPPYSASLFCSALSLKKVVFMIVLITMLQVLISGKEEPEAALSPAMDAVIRVFKRVTGLSEGEDDVNLAGVAGAAFCSIRLLVASTQAVNLIGKQGSLIKPIQQNTGASIRVLSNGISLLSLNYYCLSY